MNGRRVVVTFVIGGMFAVGLAISVGAPRSVFGVAGRTPPASLDDYSAVARYGSYGNVSVGDNVPGDCTLAAVGDLLQTWAGEEGKASAPTPSAAYLYAYQRLLGGPGGPEDGLDVPSVLDYWHRIGIDSSKITSWTRLTRLGRLSVERAMVAYGGLYAVFELPSADAPTAQGGAPHSPGPWTTFTTPVGVPVAGSHAAALVGYDRLGPYFVTWGYLQHASWAWWTTWGTALYAVSYDPHWSPNVARSGAPSASVLTTRPGPGGASRVRLAITMPLAEANRDRLQIVIDGRVLVGCTVPALDNRGSPVGRLVCNATLGRGAHLISARLVGSRVVDAEPILAVYA